jgi:hypothetical protein
MTLQQLKELREMCETMLDLEQSIRLDPLIVIQLIERNEKLTDVINQFISDVEEDYIDFKISPVGSKVVKGLSLYGSDAPLE